MDVSWSAVWNSDVSNIMNYTESDFDTSAKTDEILCDLQRTSSSNMNAASGYQTLSSRRRELQKPRRDGGGNGGFAPMGSGEPLGTAAGITLTGGYIYNALSGGNVDAVEYEG